MPVIRGFCLDSKSNKEPELHEDDGGGSDFDSDSDDDFESHDSTELAALAGGTCQSYSASTTKNRVIQVKLLNQRSAPGDGRTVKLKGRFEDAFLCPAWQIKVQVQESKPTKVGFLTAGGSPSYSVRTDGGVDKSVVALFLKSCNVHQQHIEYFLKFMEARRLEFSLERLLATVAVFKDCASTDKDIAKQIERSLQNTVPGKALHAPTFTKYVHQLFPRRASKLLESQGCQKLQQLDKSLQEEPWIFGYRTILYNRHGLLGCEAKLRDLLESKILDKADPAMVDALFIYYALCKETYSKGHTYVLLHWLKWAGHYRRPHAPVNHDILHWDPALDFLIREEVLGTDDIEGVGPIVYLSKLRYYEETIAKCIAELMGRDPWILSSTLKEEDFSGDKDQLQAAQLISNMPVVVMSGKGGCGKTYVVSKVLSKANKHIAEDIDLPQDEQQSFSLTQNGDEAAQVPQELDEHCHGDKGSECDDSTKENKAKEESIGPVLLTAPTGRAASILGKRTGIPSYTMHQVIFSFYMHKSHNHEAGESTPWKYSSVRMLVCDECSLASVRTFSDLIRILTNEAKLQQLVLLGDVNQLPSIEPGNFLSDVFSSLDQYGLSITLKTNHRAESEQIVRNAHRIAARKEPEFRGNFIPVSFEAGKSQDYFVSQKVRQLLERNLFSHEESQFIAFRRKDCLSINELCCQHYNKHPMKNCKGKTDFQVGDKVCIGKNKMCFDVYSGVEVRLCNGEIFFIKADVTEVEGKKKTRCLDLDDGERMLKVDFKELRRAKMKHAWARTIHTYQGSETGTIIYVVSGSNYETWQHVYTAVTRGRSRVFIVHDPRHLSSAVSREPITRQTRLAEFLKRESKAAGERLKSLAFDGTPVPTPSVSPDCETGDEFNDSEDDDLLIQASQAVERLSGNDVTAARVAPTGCDVSDEVDAMLRDCIKVTNGDLNTGDDSDISQYFSDDGNDDEMAQILDEAVDDYTLSQVPTSLGPLSSSSQSQATCGVEEEFFISRRNLHRRASDSCAHAQSSGAPVGYSVATQRRNTWQHRTGNHLLSPSPPDKMASRMYPSPPWTPERGSQNSTHPCLSSSPLSQGKRDCSQSDSSFQTPTKRTRGPIMTAKYSARCSACTSPIRAGVDRISLRMCNTQRKEWVHLDCVSK